MLLLAIDTATAATTAAVHDGERVLAESTTLDARRHGELLMPSVIAVLGQAGVSRADLTAVVAGTGPGPYTGLRVGLVTARVLGAALGIPVHGVCTLDAIARAAVPPPRAGSTWSPPTPAARRSTGRGTRAGGSASTDPQVGLPGSIDPAVPAAGEGPWLYPGGVR